MEVDQDVMISQFRDWDFFVELEGIKAALALNIPLLGGRWCHREIYGVYSV